MPLLGVVRPATRSLRARGAARVRRGGGGGGRRLAPTAGENPNGGRDRERVSGAHERTSVSGSACSHGRARLASAEYPVFIKACRVARPQPSSAPVEFRREVRHATAPRAVLHVLPSRGWVVSMCLEILMSVVPRTKAFTFDAYYDAVLSNGDLEQIISSADLRYPAIQLARHGGYFPPERPRSVLILCRARRLLDARCSPMGRAPPESLQSCAWGRACRPTRDTVPRRTRAELGSRTLVRR
jgi:hypothetical protein